MLKTFKLFLFYTVFSLSFVPTFIAFLNVGYSFAEEQDTEKEGQHNPFYDLASENDNGFFEYFSEGNEPLELDKDRWGKAGDRTERVVLVISPPVFHEGIQRWIEYRQEQGYKILFLPLANTKDNGSIEQEYASAPIATPSQIREKIRDAAKEYDVEAILLVGDGAPTDSASYGWRDVVPAPRVSALVVQVFGSEELLASDSYYADLDGDDLPDVPIGRLPVETPKDLEVCIDNIIHYEQNSPVGNWTRKINIVAGPNGLDLRVIGSDPGDVIEGKNPFGGISMLVTSVVDKIARKLFAEYLPQEFVLSLTQFSLQNPFCPYPADFEKTTLERINEGSLFWVYLGHGRVVGLDRYLAPSGRDYGVLEIDDCHKINCKGHAPIMLFFSCYAGAYDASCRCLAEEALLQEEGPVATVGASRRTAPYGMCSFGAALLEVAFSHDVVDNSTQDAPRLLGQIYLEAQRRTIKEFDEDESKEMDFNFPSDEEANIPAPLSKNAPQPQRQKPDSQLEWINQRLQKSLDEAEELKRKNSSFRKTIEQIATFFDPTASRLEEQVKDHIAEFNLFGDPLLRVKFPTRFPVNAPEITYSNEEITVSGKLPINEGIEAIVQAELIPADFRPNFTPPVRAKVFVESEEARQTFNETYEKANAFVVDAVRTKTKNGIFETHLRIPRDFSGEGVIRIAATTNTRYFIGSRRILIRPKSSELDKSKNKSAEFPENDF